MTRQFLLIGLYGCVVQFYYIALKLFYNPQIIFCALLLCVVNSYKIYANNVPACSPIGNGVIITSTLIHTLRCLVTTLVDAYTGVVQGVTDVSRITPSYTGLCTTFSLIYIIIKKTLTLCKMNAISMFVNIYCEILSSPRLIQKFHFCRLACKKWFAIYSSVDIFLSK